MECADCGEKAYRCSYCDGKVCGCDGGSACRESDIATCGPCAQKDLKDWGNYLWHRDVIHTALVPYFVRPQVSFPGDA